MEVALGGELPKSGTVLEPCKALVEEASQCFAEMPPKTDELPGSWQE